MDDKTKKQFDVSLNDGNKILKINSVKNEIRGNKSNFMNLKQLTKMLDECYYFKSNKLKNKKIVMQILTSPVTMDYFYSKNIYLIESDGFIAEYKEKTFDGIIARIISGDELFHLCLKQK